MIAKKKVLGQFFTRDEIWLKKHIIDFIENSHCSTVYDPFAGEGHLLKVIQEKCGIKNIMGLDIDQSLAWKHNDSLLNVPSIEDAIIVTNPPYIAKYSASRKKIDQKLKKYFYNTIYDNIYLIALDKLIAAQNNIVAIVPETFINSNYQQKNKLHSLTVIEENPFDDTETPIVVACFDGIEKNFDNIKIYKGEKYINSLGEIENKRLKPKKNVQITFNDINGWLAVRCVDTTDPNNMITFARKDKIKYDWKNRIKISSRLLTLINIDIDEENKDNFIKACNLILNNLRNETEDIVLSPFKGNMKNGRRRRRLDFKTCRAIMELAHKKVFSLETQYEKQVLF